MSTQWFDPIATLGYLAAHTTRTRLMTNVFIAAYQPQLTVSKAFATLDRLSGGRMILGIGAGHAEGEFDALGVSFSERGKATDSALAIIADALTNEWTTTAAGVEVGQRPRPVQQPMPIVIGGHTPRAYRRAVARGQGWYGFALTPEATAVSMAGLKSAASPILRCSRTHAPAPRPCTC